MTTLRRGVSLEIKSLHAREFEGHGAVFGNLDLGGDVVMPGAFRQTLADHARKGTLPLMFWHHDPRAVPGVWKAMNEDSKGLHVVGELVDTELGDEVRTLLQKRAVRGLSIGYQATDIDFDRDGNRILKSVDLWEVSLVSLAMNPLAQVEAVKARLSRDGEYVPTERELEARLRDAGLSRKTAQIIIAKLYGAGTDEGISSLSLEGFQPAEADELAAEQQGEARLVLAAITQLKSQLGGGR
jgi:HK97 family phage prohead protease